MPITRAEAEAVTRAFVRDYPGALALAYKFRETVAELYGARAAELPANLKGAYIAQETIHGGRTYRGRVDVPLANIDDAADLLVSLRHEVLGHYGANTFTPGDKRALLEGIRAARDEPTLKPLWDNIDQRYAGKTLDVRAEEVFALHCERLGPYQHDALAAAGQREFGERSFYETCIARVRPMQKADLHNIVGMVEEGLHDRSRTQQTFPLISAQFRTEERSEPMEPKKPFHEAVAEKLIEQLRAGTAPWQKPWAPGELRLPYNASTGKEYRGANSLWLHMQGHGDPRWVTYRQAEAAGAQVRRGERGTPVTYWKTHDEQPLKDEQGRPVLDGDGQPRKVRIELERPRPFSAVVFNAAQIDGLPPLEAQPVQPEPERHARAEAILANSGAAITHAEGDRAYYAPGPDRITLPARAQFARADGYYATALHELGHWTGHKSRLDRDLAHPFGSEGYAREELRAEIASLMLGERLEIGHEPGQHAAYVGSWIKALKEDPREIFRAAADAEKISTYVMGFEQERQQEAVRQADIAPAPEAILTGDAAMAAPAMDPLARIAALKAELDRLRPIHAGTLEQMDAWQTVELTYTSNAIEGNTLSRLETALIVEKGLTVGGGKTLREHLEVTNHVAALGYVRELATGTDPITERDIRQIHALVMAGFDDKHPGQYSPFNRAIAGSDIRLPSPAEIPARMSEFADWLKEEAATPDSAIEAHARLVEIHPFSDGNGRTSRLLMNLLLLRGGYPPAAIQPEDRLAYIGALEARRGPGPEQYREMMLSTVERSLAQYLDMVDPADPELRPAPSMEVEQRTYLAVPYREKDEARALGAKWDREAKAWYAPEGMDVKVAGLARWLPENTRRETMRQATPEESFGEAIRAAGLELDGPPVMDGKIHRVAVAGDHGAERSGAYAGHVEGRLPGGYIENFKTGERVNWKYEGRLDALAPPDRERLGREARERTDRRAAETAARHQAVATIAQAVWDEAPAASADHPYCAARGIERPGEHGLRVVPDSVSGAAEAAGVRIARTPKQARDMREAEPEARVFLAGDLLVPARDGEGRLWSVQSVNPAFKGFLKGGRKAGLYTVAGADPAAWAAELDKDSAIPLVLAEGYATGDTVARLMGYPVVVAFDSGNLDAVARGLRERWPDRPLLIAADNDHRAEREQRPDGRTGVNVGVEKARDAAANHRGGVMVPAFTAGDSGSDWNDYARRHGDEAARKELERQVAVARGEAAINAERLTSLAREREAEARDDPTTTADDAKVVHERSAAHDLMARAIFGSAEVRAEAIDAIVANGMGKSRPAAAVGSAIAHSNARLQDEVKEQRQTVHDGQNVSTRTEQQQDQPDGQKPRRTRGRGHDAGL